MCLQEKVAKTFDAQRSVRCDYSHVAQESIW